MGHDTMGPWRRHGTEVREGADRTWPRESSTGRWRASSIVRQPDPAASTTTSNSAATAHACCTRRRTPATHKMHAH